MCNPYFWECKPRIKRLFVSQFPASGAFFGQPMRPVQQQQQQPSAERQSQAAGHATPGRGPPGRATDKRRPLTSL